MMISHIKTFNEYLLTTEGVKSAYLNYKHAFDQPFIKSLATFIPQKYIQQVVHWMYKDPTVKKYATNKGKQIEIQTQLKSFDYFVQNNIISGVNKDIQKYETYDDFIGMLIMKNKQYKTSEYNKDIKRFTPLMNTNDLTKLYSDDSLLVIRINTEKGAKAFNTKTHWCIAKSNNNPFNDYKNHNIDFITIINYNMLPTHEYRYFAVGIFNQNLNQMAEVFNQYNNENDKFNDAASKYSPKRNTLYYNTLLKQLNNILPTTEAKYPNDYADFASILLRYMYAPPHQTEKINFNTYKISSARNDVLNVDSIPQHFIKRLPQNFKLVINKRLKVIDTNDVFKNVIVYADDYADNNEYNNI